MRTSLMLALLVAACGPTISMTSINAPPRPLAPRAASSVEVFTTKRPARAYVEVAVFTAKRGDADDHLDALREHAGEHGCDGLVFTVMPSEQSVAVIGEGGGTSTGSSSATCIVWSDPTPDSGHAAAPAPAPEATPAAAPQAP